MGLYDKGWSPHGKGIIILSESEDTVLQLYPPVKDAACNASFENSDHSYACVRPVLHEGPHYTNDYQDRPLLAWGDGLETLKILLRLTA